jgi:hypothetical protein
MKNKYQKLHRIVIGRSGSGKSFNILSSIKEDNKINIICYPEAYSCLPKGISRDIFKIQTRCYSYNTTTHNRHQ